MYVKQLIIGRKMVKDKVVRGKIMYKNYDDLPIVLSVKEIQVILGIGRRQAYDLVKSNKFKVLKINNRILIPKSSFINWFEGKQ